MRAVQEQRLQLRGPGITWEPEDIDHHYDEDDNDDSNDDDDDDDNDYNDDDDDSDNTNDDDYAQLHGGITWEPEDIDHHYDDNDDDSNDDDSNDEDDGFIVQDYEMYNYWEPASHESRRTLITMLRMMQITMTMTVVVIMMAVKTMMTQMRMIVQSCEMSNILHGANLPNRILPQEKCINRDKFNTYMEWN